MPGGFHPPLAVILSWPPPDTTENAARRPDSDWIICIVFAVLATLAVTIRLSIGFYKRGRLFMDDWFIVIGCFFTLGTTTAICLAFAKYGLDRHVWDAIAYPQRLVDGRKVYWAIEFLYLLATCFIKLSILLFVKRMTNRASHFWVHNILWATIVFVALTTLAFEISLFLECRPFHAFWDQVNLSWTSTHEYFCVNEGRKVLAAGIFSIIQDFMVATIPLVLVWNLRMDLAKKIGVCTVFAIGYLVCGISIARLYYSYKVFFDTYDVTWESSYLGIWTQAELNVAIVVACAPSLKVFFRQIHQRLRRSQTQCSKGSSEKAVNSGSEYTRSDTITPSTFDRSTSKAGLWTQRLADLENETITSADEEAPVVYFRKEDWDRRPSQGEYSGKWYQRSRKLESWYDSS